MSDPGVTIVTRGRGSAMIMLPAPWEIAEPAQFRLAGFGGAALFLRSQVLPGVTGGAPGLRVGVDVMLLAPDYHVWYLGRPVSDGLVDRLADWFLRAAADFEPQDSVQPFVDDACGLTLTITASTEARVCLEVLIRKSLDGSDPGTEKSAASPGPAHVASDRRTLDVKLQLR